MKITVAEVNYIANLSKLSFTEDEAEHFAVEFEHILEHFHAMDKLDLEDIDLHEMDKNAVSVLRKDESAEQMDRETLFQNVKSMRDTYIQVPKIIE